MTMRSAPSYIRWRGHRSWFRVFFWSHQLKVFERNAVTTCGSSVQRLDRQQRARTKSHSGVARHSLCTWTHVLCNACLSSPEIQVRGSCTLPHIPMHMHMWRRFNVSPVENYHAAVLLFGMHLYWALVKPWPGRNGWPTLAQLQMLTSTLVAFGTCVPPTSFDFTCHSTSPHIPWTLSFLPVSFITTLSDTPAPSFGLCNNEFSYIMEDHCSFKPSFKPQVDKKPFPPVKHELHGTTSDIMKRHWAGVDIRLLLSGRVGTLGGGAGAICCKCRCRSVPEVD